MPQKDQTSRRFRDQVNFPDQVAVKPRTPKTLSIRDESPLNTIVKHSVDETPTYEEDKD